MKKKALIIDDLHHKYDTKRFSNWILKAINLKIETGELLGLLGPSGCGKTTILRLIAGFEAPSKGSITLNKITISTLNKVLSPEKRNIGMVFQDYALFPHLTVMENVMFGLKNKKNRSRVDYLLNIVVLIVLLVGTHMNCLEVKNKDSQLLEHLLQVQILFY